MKYLIIAALVLVGCSQQSAVDALRSASGQLFCTIQMAGGGSFVAGLTATALSGAAPTAGPLIVIATNAGKAAVDDDCAKAAANVAGATSGVPVSPPAVPVANLSIVAPSSPVVNPR